MLIMAKMEPVELEVHTIISAVTVRPGDTLVVAVNLARPLTDQEADDIRRRLETVLPGVSVEPVVASALVVYRPDARHPLSRPEPMRCRSCQRLSGMPSLPCPDCPDRV